MADTGIALHPVLVFNSFCSYGSCRCVLYFIYCSGALYSGASVSAVTVAANWMYEPQSSVAYITQTTCEDRYVAMITG